MPSITTFLRLEPRVRDEDLEAGLSARVYDPAWMLARQWQLGEFMGEDAGTPVSARLRAERSRLTRYFPNPDSVTARTAVPLDSGAAPLEAVVEREAVHGRGEWRVLERAEAGLEFLRRLAAAELLEYVRAYVEAYPLPRPATPAERLDVDAAALRYVEVMAGRVPDGEALFASLRGAVRRRTLPAEPPVDRTDRKTMLLVARSWVAWVETLFSEPPREPAAWDANRLEYRFAVAAPAAKDDLVLEAAEYPGGSLDWYAFAERRGTLLPRRRGDPSPEKIVRTLVPTPLRFKGMPNLRWWELEDGDVDFGRVSAAPTDLARMLVLQYMLVFGNDFFAFPVELTIGSVCLTHSLVVTDTFGVRVRVLPSAQTNIGAPGWTMFSLSAHGPATAPSVAGDATLFLLPPTVAQMLSSPPIEEVLFARDEMANMAWAIARRVEGGTGASYERIEEERRRAGASAPSTSATPAPGAPSLVYQLETAAPANWFPLVPVRSGTALWLKAGRMTSAAGVVPEPQGELLRALERVYEEEIPREGVRVTRDYQYARWVDGSTHLWIGRRKSVGRGEGSSGLRYDIVRGAEPP
jgi:hypothetical protein